MADSLLWVSFIHRIGVALGAAGVSINCKLPGFTLLVRLRASFLPNTLMLRLII